LVPLESEQSGLREKELAKILFSLSPRALKCQANRVVEHSFGTPKKPTHWRAFSIDLFYHLTIPAGILAMGLEIKKQKESLIMAEAVFRFKIDVSKWRIMIKGVNFHTYIYSSILFLSLKHWFTRKHIRLFILTRFFIFSNTSITLVSEILLWERSKQDSSSHSIKCSISSATFSLQWVICSVCSWGMHAGIQIFIHYKPILSWWSTYSSLL
jgi:hypothetical protein